MDGREGEKEKKDRKEKKIQPVTIKRNEYPRLIQDQTIFFSFNIGY